MKDVVEKVVKNNNCVGCGFCSKFYKKCYVMNLTKDGFYRPRKVQKNTDPKLNKKFKKICPGYVRREKISSDSKIGIWGNYEKICTTYSADEEIRFKASTGGTLTSVLLYLIDNRKVDSVLQVKSIEKKPYITQYGFSNSREDIIKSIGSKYQPSSMFLQLNKIKEFDGVLAVVGKPCDIATLRRYLKLYSLENKVYCYITFLCGGLPSLNATLKILKENNIDKDTITELKYRGDGWPGYFKVSKAKDELMKMSYTESWAKKLSKEIQPACRICTDGIGEMADIVLGDAWNLDDTGKINLDESDGINITIERTSRGKEIIENAIERGYIKIQDKTINEEILNMMQPYQIMHRKQVAFKILGKKIALKAIPKYPHKLFFKYSRKEKFIKNIKICLTSIKRELKGNL